MLYLICGGASSGKSEYAENICMKINGDNIKKYYVATMISYDKECKKRINIHRQKRKNKGFLTIEQPIDIKNIEKIIGKNNVLLVECLSNLVANEMYENKISPQNCADKIYNEICILIEKAKDIVIVSNSVFSSGEDIKDYSRELGKLNCLLAQKADFVAEICSDCPIIHKNKTGEFFD